MSGRRVICDHSGPDHTGYTPHPSSTNQTNRHDWRETLRCGILLMRSRVVTTRYATLEALVPAQFDLVAFGNADSAGGSR